MEQTLKYALIDANRLEDVTKLLEHIIQITDSKIGSFPVEPYVDDDNVTHWRVNTRDVNYQAKIVLKLITDNTIIHESLDVFELGRYIYTINNTDLHNYANRIAHKAEPDIDIETIRIGLVLQSILDDLCFYNVFEDQIPLFDIPEGWKKND